MTAATCLLMTFAGSGMAAALPGSPTPEPDSSQPPAVGGPCPSASPSLTPQTSFTTPTPLKTSGSAVPSATPSAPVTPAPGDGERWYRREAVPPPNVTPTPATTGTPSCWTPGGTPGAGSIGDPTFPDDGNGGYTVGNYFIDLGVTPESGNVNATVIIGAKATQDLSSFDLDFRGPQITNVTVDTIPAQYSRAGSKLTVVPAGMLPKGSAFNVVVHYAGMPGPLHDPNFGEYGWVRTNDGALVVSEPDGASTWFPCNDHPSNKATYIFRVTVPTGYQAVANGVEETPVTTDGQTTYVWDEKSPMATYLATVAIGKFATKAGRSGNLPVFVAADPKFAGSLNAVYATTVKAVKLETAMFGPYPFASVGGIIAAPKLNYALENQERPVYAGFAPDDDFIVHEIAHQWFGDSVSLTRWSDIWLNEGFATYAEWLWNEKNGKGTAKQMFDRYLAQPANSAIFTPAPGAPGAKNLFPFSIYIRGAMTLQALRDKVGDADFFMILKDWAAQHKYGNATVPQFIALVKKVASPRVPGQQIDHLFNVWLYQKTKPTTW
jgi:aminopeptidase N